MEFADILSLSFQQERRRLSRPLPILMRDEYRLDNDLQQQVETGAYRFPDALLTGTDKRSLTRIQEQFSAKVHVPETPLYFHRHEFVEMLYMYRGECKQYVENLSNCLILREGDAFLLNQNITHGLLQEKAGAVLIKIIIPTDTLSHEFIQHLRGQQGEFWLGALSPRREYYHCLHYTGCTGDERLFIERMMAEYYLQNEYKQDACASWLQLLLIALERQEGQSRRYKLSHSAVEMGRVTQYIYEHSEGVTLEELARAFSYSSSYLSRIIKESCGMNFLDLLRECRLEKASVLLTGSGLAVEEIAQRVGYRNAASVYEGIREKFGLSPGEYRRKYGQTNGGHSTNE